MISANVLGGGIDNVYSQKINCNSKFFRMQHFFHDSLSSITYQIDDHGNPIGIFSYDTFGKPIPPKGGEHKYRYTSRRHDNDTGLYYYRSRWYMPDVGRFISRDVYPPDPLDTQGLNPYSYVQNNPLRWVDPYGEKVEIIYGKAYGKHPYGHIAIRIQRGNKDIVYDFGRYGKTWGFQKYLGEGILRVWDGKKYIQQQQRKRNSIGYIFPDTMAEDEEKIEQYFEHFVKHKGSVNRTENQKNRFTKYEMKIYRNYNGLKFNCAIISIDALKQGIEKNSKYSGLITEKIPERYLPLQVDKILSIIMKKK